MVSTANLLRFIDPNKGPIESLLTASYPGVFRRWLWYSVAQLHASCFDSSRQFDLLKFGGGSWSVSRELSQRKSVVEAIERWAYQTCKHDGQYEWGQEIDDTTNGFAAAPVELGESFAVEHAYHEALERWAMEIFWNSPNKIKLLPTSFPELIKKFFHLKKINGSLLRAELTTKQINEIPSKKIQFSLCLIFIDGCGVVPGSACGFSGDESDFRASVEAYTHYVASKRMSLENPKLESSITDKRLFHFSRNLEARNEVERRVHVSQSGHPLSETPDIIFNKSIAGVWQPDVFVNRVLVEGTTPITVGGLDRFLI